MESLLNPQLHNRPKRTFRDYLSAIAALAALLVWAYQWIAFPAADVRKDLQLVGLGLLVASFLVRLGRRKTAK
jgi:hypothetical protein